jgi:hypothetical protein
MSTVLRGFELWQWKFVQNRCLFLTLLIVSMFLAGIVGCAGSSRTAELLATEYVTMANDDLQLYYYQLEDQIVADERKTTGSSVSFGVGRGSYGRHGGVGMSTGGTTQAVAIDLRDRRNLVRLELQKRGITP